MKILYIITKSEIGGAQIHVDQLCNFFKKDFEVAVLSYPGGWLEERSLKNGVKFFANPFFSNSFSPIVFFKSFFAIKRIIDEFSPDIVHCHSSAAGVYGRLVVRKSIPTIYTAHGWGFNTGVPLFQKITAVILEKFLSRYTDKIICVSGFVKNLGLKFAVARASKMLVIPNGVERIERKEKNNSDKVRVLFIGRLSEPKDPLLLLKSFYELEIKNRENIQLDIIGGGGKFLECQSFVIEKKLQNVNLLGSRDREETLSYLKKADIFILISKWEGLPITVLEAMSCGLPVISSKVGGIGEAVDESSGFLVKNTKEDIELAMTILASDRALREKMGQNARQIFLEKYTLEKMCERTKEVYNSIL